MLATASAHISTPVEINARQKCRVLFDSGSELSYISSRVVKDLNATPVRSIKLKVNVFGSTSSIPQDHNVFELLLHHLQGSDILTLIEYPFICRQDAFPFAIEDFTEFADILPADENLNTGSEIDILIGANYFYRFMGNSIRSSESGLTAVKTKFGWSFLGPLRCEQPAQIIETNCQLAKISLDEQVKKFWELDSLGILADSDDVHNYFNDTVSTVNGRYSVRLPWQDNAHLLKTNYQLARNRLMSTLRKLRENPSALSEYELVFDTQLQQGILELVSDVNVTENKVHYLAHYPVYKIDSSTTKVRIVLDGAAKCTKRDVSINDCVYAGPNLLNESMNLLLRFRISRVGVVADVEKAFHQVSVDPVDRDSLRILWKPSTQPDSAPLVVYRYTRVVFGLKCSPFLLYQTIKHHLNSVRDTEVNNSILEQIERDIYSDNLITGVDTLEEGVELYTSAKKIFGSASMNIREWLSSDQ